MAASIEATVWKYDSKYALVHGPIPFLVRDEKNDIICYGKAEKDRIVPLNAEENAKAFKLGFITVNRTTSGGDIELQADIWEYDPTFHKLWGSVPFLVRDEKNDIICYGKAAGSGIVPLNEREIAVANGLGLILWDKPLSSVSRWPRLSEIENKTIIDFAAITIDIDRISSTDDSILSIVEASLGLLAGSIRGDPSVINDFLDHRDVNPSITIDNKDPIIFQQHSRDYSTTYWVLQGNLKVREERDKDGRLVERVLYYDTDIQYKRAYSDNGLLTESCATIQGRSVGPCYRFNRTSSIQYMLNGVKIHEKAWNDYITKPIQEGTLFPKELCLLVGAYLF